MKYFLSICLMIGLMFSGQDLTAQEDSKWPKLDKSPMQFSYYPSQVAFRNYFEGDDRTMTPKIKVAYSSPAKNDRQVIGNLVPFGQEWRIGANEATEITFYQDVEIGGSLITAGIYTLSAEVNQDNWIVNISTQRHIWGNENRDKSKTISSVKLDVQASKKTREHLAIGFREIDDQTAHMVIEWEDTQVNLPIHFNVVSFPGVDASPGDMAHYPDNSRYSNYLKPEELDGAKPKIKVSYARPQKKGRKLFGELLPFGEVWRVGANESTEIALFQDAVFGDTDVTAGRYNLYAEVNRSEWTFILNTDMPAWGAANRDESKDVATITVPVTIDTESLEALSIIFNEIDKNNIELVIGWDTTRAALPIKFK